MAFALCGHPLEVIVDLAIDLLGVPAEHVAHQFRGDRSRGNSAIPGLDRDAGAPCENVFEVQRTLVSRRVDNLGLDVVVGAGEGRGEGGSLADELEQFIRHHAVAVEQVFDAHLMHVEHAGDLGPTVPRGLVALGPDQADVLGDAGGDLPVERCNRFIDCILRHDAVGGPLAAGHDDETRNAVRDDVLARQFRGLVGLARQQRTQARVHALDVIARERNGEHLVDVIENVVDVRGGRGRMRLVEVPVGVGRADDPVPAPRDHEEHALLRAQQHAHFRLEAIPRNDEVHALRRPNLELAALAHHRLGVIRPYTGCVHDLLGADLKTFTRLDVVRLHADDALTDLEETLHPDAAGNVSAIEGCRPREGGNVTCVIHLGVVVGDAADERVIREARNRSHNLRPGEMTVVRNARRPPAGVAQDVIEQHAGADVEALEHALLERIEKTHRLDEMRCESLQQQPALLERLAHEAEVELFEVPDAAVHELGRPARGSARPVPGLDHADAQPSGHGVECAAGSDDSPTNDEDVELLLLQRGYGFAALIRT